MPTASAHLLALESLRSCAVQRGWVTYRNNLDVAESVCHQSATAGGPTLLPGPRSLWTVGVAWHCSQHCGPALAPGNKLTLTKQGLLA